MKRLLLKTIVAAIASTAVFAALPTFAQDIKERTLKFTLNGPEGHLWEV